MGIFEKLFGGSPKYPELAADAPAQKKIDEMRQELEELSRKVNDRLEVVPAEHAAYVYIGKPPKRFGIAWIHDGKISSLKELADEHNLSQIKVGKLMDKLQMAYENASEAPRFTAHLSDTDVVVIPSEGFENEVHEIIEGATH